MRSAECNTEAAGRIRNTLACILNESCDRLQAAWALATQPLAGDYMGISYTDGFSATGDWSAWALLKNLA